MARGFRQRTGTLSRDLLVALPNIWAHGDWALRDEDGHWFILGRSDDTLKVAGKRVGPAEVESILVAHEASEAAVIGVPHEVKGECMVAFAVLRPQIASRLLPALAEELRALVADALGKPLRPESVHFVPAFPTNTKQQGDAARHSSGLPRPGSREICPRSRTRQRSIIRSARKHAMTCTNPLKIRSIHHVEFWVGQCEAGGVLLPQCVGFRQFAYAGLETGSRDVTSYALKQGKAQLVLSTPLQHGRLHCRASYASTATPFGISRFM